MASLKKLRQAKVPLSVPVVAGYDDATGKPIEDTIRVVYYPHIYDGEFEKAATALYADFKDDDEIILLRSSILKFVHVIAAWDLKADEEDDQPIPLTEDALLASGVTQDLLEGILTAVQEDRAPKATIKNQRRK